MGDTSSDATWSRAGALAVALGVLLLAGASVPAQDRTFKGKECSVKTDAPPAIGKTIAKRIDRFCGVFADFYDALGLEEKNDNKIIARVFGSHADFAEYYRRTSGGRTDTPAAYFSRSMNAIVLYNDEGDVYLRQTLFHECSHNYLNRFTYDAPRWFNEGLAEYFEGWRMTAEGDLVQVRPHLYDLLLVQEALKADKGLKPSELVALSDSEFRDFRKTKPELDPYLHYATAWSVLNYCLLGPDEADRERMVTFIRDLNQRGATASFEVDDWDAFDARWRDYTVALAPERVDVADHLLVAGGYRRGDHWEEAVAEYEAAVALDDESFAALHGLGTSLLRVGDLPRARATLVRASEVDPDDPRPWYELARLTLERDLPDHPRDPERALELAEKALDLAGGDDRSMRLMLARAQDGVGKPDRAIKTIRKILKDLDEEDEVLATAYESWIERFKEHEKELKRRR